MCDIIFLSENQNYDKTFLEFLNANFVCENCVINSKSVQNLCNKNLIKIIVVWAEDISSDAAAELRKIMGREFAVDFVILSSKYTFTLFASSGLSSKIHNIELPCNLTDFGEQFTRLAKETADLRPEGRSSDGIKKQILLVDDDVVCLRTMSSWLGGFYNVSVAKSGAACISCLSKKKPDLILLDYEMPVCNGVQTLGMIRAEPEYSKIPVVFLTGVSDSNKVMNALKLKPDGYILKNTDRLDFIAKIDAILSKV